MAFTPEQESVLEQVIEAFENGKRLSDLPTAQGTNPYNMMVEVLDEDGESKKAALAALLPYESENCSYGIEFDTAVSSPTCTRIGSTDLHLRCPIQNRMRGCLLDDNGQVVEYLDPLDWRNNDRTGNRGQVMVEIPMHYRKFETDGTKRRVLLSELPLPGYHQVPKAYISAYQATVQRSTNKLASVVNDNTDYRGGNNTSAWDDTYRSLLGRPATSISRTNFRAYARKRKSGSTEWNCYTYDICKTVFWLFVVEYATLNSQANYNAEKTADGYCQGGLGAGVTNWNNTDWTNFNSSNPFVPCGYTDELGNRTGVKSYTASNDDDIEVTSSVPRYHGIENPFGHIYHWVDGVNVKVSAEIENGGDGTSKVYVCHDPSQFKDNGYDGYSHVGNEARTSNYVKEVIFGEEGDIDASVVGGGSTTYFCDYHYVSIPSSGEALRGLLFGGRADSGAGAGLASSTSDHAPSSAYAYIGSRLCFCPNA